MNRRVEAFAYGMFWRRQELDRSRCYLARICGSTEPTLYAIECQGRNPHLWLGMAIAAALGFESVEALADYGENLMRLHKKEYKKKEQPNNESV